MGVLSIAHRDGKTRGALDGPIQHYGVITLLVTPMHHLAIEILRVMHPLEGESIARLAYDHIRNGIMWVKQFPVSRIGKSDQAG